MVNNLGFNHIYIINHLGVNQNISIKKKARKENKAK